MSRILVATPQLEAPLHGFLVAAIRSEDPDSLWLERGFEFVTPEEHEVHFWHPTSTGGDRIKSDAVERTGDTTEGDSFVVELAMKESTYNRDWAGLKARARNGLEQSLSWAIERELWSSDAAGDIGVGPFTTAGADVVESTAVSARVGLALLSEALGSTFGGMRGMIHAPVAVGSLLVGGPDEAATLTGERLATRSRGDILCIGSGYDGTNGPAGDAAADTSGTLTRWMFATPMLAYRLDDLTVVPEAESDGMDRRTNTYEVRAEQAMALSAATPLADRIFAVRVDLTK